MKELTAEEKKAIRALRKLAKDWPASLWLFCADGQLNVMRCGEDGERVYYAEDGGGVHHDYQVARVLIPSDGGDW